MSNSGKQSPLGVNVLGTFLQNQGLTINPTVIDRLGTSTDNNTYVPGTIVTDTCLNLLTEAINRAYIIGEPTANITALSTNDATDKISVASILGLNVEDPVKFVNITIQGEANISFGGISANTTYYIKEINQLAAPQAATISLALTAGSNVAVDITSNVKPATDTYAIMTRQNIKIANTTYANLITIGANVIPALGNSPPPTYEIDDPSGYWEGQATTGYAVSGNVDKGQDATWLPYDLTNPNFSITQWGYLRLLALQGHNDFDWNGIVDPIDVQYGNVQYKEFTSSILNAQGFVSTSNQTILALQNSKDYLQGVYSNMDDLTSGDVTGVSLSTHEFGNDLMNLGKALNLSTINTFGLPSNLLQTLQKNNALTPVVTLAMLGAGLSQSEIMQLTTPNDSPITKEQQQKIYGAFLIVQNTDLSGVLDILECKTEGLESLADLLDVKKCFPKSYQTLTVPLYTGKTGPTNSKTYYLIYADNAVNGQLDSSIIKEQVGTQIPISEPCEAPPESPSASLREAINNIPNNVTLADVVDTVPVNSTAIQGAAVNSLETLLGRRYKLK